MLKIAIIECNPPSIRRTSVINQYFVDNTKQQIDKYLSGQSIEYNVETFIDSSVFKSELENGKYYDIVFTNVGSDRMGVETAKIINAMHLNTLIIFITSYPYYEPAQPIFYFKVIHRRTNEYLYAEICTALSNAMILIESLSTNPFILQKGTGGAVNQNDVVYCYEDSGSSVAVLNNGGACDILKTIDALQKELDPAVFLRVDGNLINILHIESYQNPFIYLSNSSKIFLDFKRKDYVLSRINHFREKHLEESYLD